jgi:AraC family transcriptional regulator, arabinose operon regulatory protein
MNPQPRYLMREESFHSATSELLPESRPTVFGRPQKGEGFDSQRIVVLPRSIVAIAREQPLLRGLLPTDIGYFPAAKGHLRGRATGVDQAILIYCAKGVGWCELRGSRHEIAAGSLLAIPPGVPHAYGAAARHPWTISWFHAVGDDIAPMLAELGVSAEKPVVPLTDDPQWLALFEEALGALEHGYTTAHLLHASRALGHLLSLTIWRRRQSTRSTPDPRQKVTRCIDYMKQHLDQPLRLSQLAAIANMSPSHFKTLFKQHVGYACIDYFIRLRIHHACQLLDTTNLSAKVIATQVGYADPLWFSKAFRGVTGMPPSAYRRKHKG